MPYLPKGPDTTPKYVYNPTKTDFTATYANDENVKIEYTCRAGEVTEFPTYIANHMIKHLAQKILFERGRRLNYPDELEKIKQEITISL